MLNKNIAEKKYALIAIVLAFIGIFILSINDSVLIGIFRIILFVAISVLIFFFPVKETPPLPEPRTDEEYEMELKLALEKRRSDLGNQTLSTSKKIDYYIPRQELPNDLMEKSEQDFEQMTISLLEITRSALAADSVGFYLMDSKGTVFNLRVYSCNPGFSLLDEVNKSNSLLDSVLINNRVILENQIPRQSNAINYHPPEDPKIVSFLGAPVHYNDKAIGLLFADATGKDHFSESDKNFIKNLSNTISTGIANTDRLYETASVAKSYSLFEKLNQQLASSLTSKEIFTVIIEHLIQNYTADRLTISTLTGTGEFVVEQIVGPRDIVRPGDKIEINDGLIGLIIRQAKPLMIGNVDKGGGDYTARFFKNEPHGQPMSSFLGVPAINAGRVIAVITLESFRPDSYEEDDKNLLTAMAGHVALALNRGHMLKSLELLTLKDDVSGAWNERGFKQRWQEEKARSKRFNEKLCLIKFDIDHFSEIETSHGKSSANALLSDFTGMVKGIIRTVDYIARVGKDVFLIILPSTSRAGGKILSERIRKKIAENHFYIEGSIFQTTVSGAIMEFPEMSEDDDEIMEKLDKTIRYCKAKEGNQVMIYTAKIETPEQR